jgi:hypothetical protein
MLFNLVIIGCVSAFQITTDDISQTSITWNLSQKGENTIEEIALDGILLDNYSPNATRIVQSNLKPNEQHIITITDSSLELSELAVSTLPEETTESENFFSTINIWILILLALVFLISAIVVNIGFLAFIGTIFTIIGIIGSIGNSFTTGLIFVIMCLATLLVGFSSYT